MASRVGYGTSFPVCPSPTLKFCAPLMVHKIPKTFIQNASLELISHHLLWTNSELNVSWMCKQNHDWIYQATVRHDAAIFSVPKSSGYICNLLSKWHLRETLSNNTQLKTKHFRTAVCQLSCFIDWQEQNWKLSNRNQILALLINRNLTNQIL